MRISQTNHFKIISGLIIGLFNLSAANSQGLVGRDWGCRGPHDYQINEQKNVMKQVKTNDPRYLTALENLADIYRYVDPQRSPVLWRRAVQIRMRNLKSVSDLPELAESWTWLGRSSQDVKQFKNAIAAYKQAIQCRRHCMRIAPRDRNKIKSWDKFCDQHYRLQVDQEWLTECYLDAGMRSEALHSYDQLITTMMQPGSCRTNLYDLRKKFKDAGLKLTPEPKFQ